MTNLSKILHRIAPALLVVTAAAQVSHAVVIADLVRIKGTEQSILVGMGLVVGLKGTGDGGKFAPAMESLAEVVRQQINANTVSQHLKDSKNVALVALEATTPASGVREGDRVDVHVSALGSAKSLEGGRLLVMPMVPARKDLPVIYAYASGRVTIENERIPTGGVIRDGAQLVRDIRAQYLDEAGRMTLVIREPNATFQVADTIASTINDLIIDGPKIARAVDQKNIVVNLPQAELKNPAPFIAEILNSFLDPGFIETGARVRINEKTGTIVMSGDVQISPVMVSQGNLTIRTITPPVEPTREAPLVEQGRHVAIDPEGRGDTKLANLIAAFDQLKVGVKDRIAIIKEIHSMGKLHAELTFD